MGNRKELPHVRSNIPLDQRLFFNKLLELINGDGPDRVLRASDLTETGQYSFNSGTGSITYEGGGVSTSTPPSPINLTASGTMTAIILEWEGTGYDGHSYTEIWRADTDNLSLASKVGMASGQIYADAVGSDASHYYWAKFVNVNDVSGGFNATAGTLGETAPDLAYVMDMLAETYGTGSEAPFFQLDAPTDIGGVTIPAGTYIKAAFIYEAMITNAMIKNAAIDNAKIADLAVSAAKIANATITGAKIANATIGTANIALLAVTEALVADAAITNAKIGNIIQSASYSAGTAGWKLDKNGDLEVNDGTFRGALSVKSATTGARTEIENDTIKVYDSTGTLRVLIGDLT